MISTPAATVADVLAKLRWVVGQLDIDIFSEAPHLAEAYQWEGGSGDGESMIVSVWADMERLFGGGENAEIWRPSVIDRLLEFDAQRKRNNPSEA